LYKKINEYTYEITDYKGNAIANETGNCVALQRVFGLLSTALSSYGFMSPTYLNSSILSSIETAVCIACYNDEALGLGFTLDTAPVEMETVTSDSDYFVRVFAPNNTQTEVNVNQRHNGTPGTGYRLLASYGSSAFETVLSAAYTEIEGLEINTQSNPNMSAIKFGLSKGVYIAKNIISGSTGHGIEIDTINTAKDVIVNNIIYDCLGDGISVGGTSTVSNTNVFNNTVVGCTIGIHFKKPGSDTNLLDFNSYNNLVQDSVTQDFVYDNSTYAGSMDMQNNLSLDGSSQFYGGINNLKFSEVVFVDKPANNYDLDPNDDQIAIDKGLDLSSNEFNSFLTDVIERPREVNEWDIGAFEVSAAESALAETELMVGPVEIEYLQVNATNTPPILKMYIRELASFRGTGMEFISIAALNTYLDANTKYDSFSLIICIEGGKSFQGSFSLRSRSTKDVTILTEPSEMPLGPSTIVYDGPLVDATSDQELLTLKFLKIRPLDDTQDYLIDNGSSTDNIKFVNSIVQVNKHAIVDTLAATIKSYNSQFIYRNSGVSGSTDLYFANNTAVLGHEMANTAIISYNEADLTFSLNTNTLSVDQVYNPFGYNYAVGFNISFGNINVTNPNVDKDPKFLEAELTTREFVINTVMAFDFEPSLLSPMRDKGDNAFVTTIEDIPTDIIGLNRIFDFGTVDIGPYEIQLFQISFSSEEIVKVFQDKLLFDFSNKTCKSTFGDTVYLDLYEEFKYSPDYRKEFVRESKVIIKLREITNDHRLFSDKKREEVDSFEAYYDIRSRSIVLTKSKDLISGLFNSMFDGDKYEFFFDQLSNRLIVYLNDTHEKGLSGSRNAVNNVRFGGASIVNK